MSEASEEPASSVFDQFAERWPTAGDRLLLCGRHSAFVGDAAERNHRLLLGYKHAGDILIRNALSGEFDPDNLIFPALFSYRHYVELALKATVEAHGWIAGLSLGVKNHNLLELWALFMKIAVAFGEDPKSEAAVAVAACVAEFAALDANSTVFRYAKAKDGHTPVLPKGQLDIVNLHDVMNGIENFFECADLEFSHKAEFASEAVDSI